MAIQCAPGVTVWTLVMLALLTSAIASLLALTTKARVQLILFILTMIFFVGIPTWALLFESYFLKINPNFGPIPQNI